MNSFSLAAIWRARHLFVDWDGCLVERGVLKPGAHRFLRLAAGRVSIISNNSTDTPASLSRFLWRQGVDVPPAQFFLAGDVTLQLVAARAWNAPVYMLGNQSMQDHARTLGLRLASRMASDVVLLRDTTFNFQKLECAANLLREGARLVVANPDYTHPCGAGIALETGVLLAALSSCIDVRQVDVTMVGKPGPMLFERALTATQCKPDEVVMIGDGPNTDIAGAQSLGIPSVLIGDHIGITLETVVQSLLTSRRQEIDHDLAALTPARLPRKRVRTPDA